MAQEDCAAEVPCQSAKSGRNMTKIFRGFRFVILIAAMLPLSCATSLKPAKSLPKLDDRNSIIFGKIEVWKNGKPMAKPYETFLDPDPLILNHISRYVSDASLNRNKFVAGEYAFPVRIFKDGYFAWAIPPGEYYFVEFDYCGIFNAAPLEYLRTYMGNGTPFLMTFDVPADKAVYIGTIRHDIHAKWDNLFFFKGTITINSVDNFEEAREWFLKLNQRFGTNVVDGGLKIRDLSK
jgi:hypothetical protein